MIAHNRLTERLDIVADPFQRSQAAQFHLSKCRS
jgi:hypothetical protein